MAPAFTIFSASSFVRTPPDALTPISDPTAFLMRAISSAVAPPVENPVEVLTKSAPALLAISHAFTFSASVRRHVSSMTLTIVLPWAARTTARISLSTARWSPDFMAPILSTMSHSCAPSPIAFLVSNAFASGETAPRGKPMTVQTFTPVRRSSFALRETYHGFTHTEQKWYSAASRQRFSTCFAVASAFSRVWSIMPARSLATFPIPLEADMRAAPFATNRRTVSSRAVAHWPQAEQMSARLQVGPLPVATPFFSLASTSLVTNRASSPVSIPPAPLSDMPYPHEAASRHQPFSSAMILSTRRWWRPPPKGVSSQTFTISFAAAVSSSGPPSVSTLAQLCSRLLIAVFTS